MLSANDMMIGDLVYCFDPDEPNDKQINKISAIRVEYNEGSVKFEQFTDWFENEWIAPIPLTPEILESNGFEKFMSYHDRYIRNICLLYYWHENRITIRPFNHEPWIELAPVRNVHELQHALRLCGLNDLADNFKV